MSTEERDSDCSTTEHQNYELSDGSHNAKATTNGPFKLRYKNKLGDEDVDEESCTFKSKEQWQTCYTFVSLAL